MPHHFHAGNVCYEMKNFLQAFIDTRFFIGDHANAKVSQLPFIHFSDFSRGNVVLRFDAFFQAE